MLNRAKVSGVHYRTLNCQALTYISEKRELWLYRPITENIQVLQDISIPLSPSYANSHGKVPFNFLHAFFFFFLLLLIKQLLTFPWLRRGALNCFTVLASVQQFIELDICRTLPNTRTFLPNETPSYASHPKKQS